MLNSEGSRQLTSGRRGTDKLGLGWLGQESREKRVRQLAGGWGACSDVFTVRITLEVKTSEQVRFIQAEIDTNDMPIFIGLERQLPCFVLGNKCFIKINPAWGSGYCRHVRSSMTLHLFLSLPRCQHWSEWPGLSGEKLRTLPVFWRLKLS